MRSPRLARKSSRLPVLEVRVEPAAEEGAALEFQRRHPRGPARAVGRGGRRSAARSRRPLTALIETSAMARRNLHSRQMGETAKAPVDVFAKARSHDRLEQLEAAQGARPPPLLPAAHLAGGPGGRDGGPRDDHARLQQLPGADRRRAGQAGRPRGARDLRHRSDRLAPAERHDAPARRSRARAGRVDGHRRRDRLHDRLPVEPRLHRDDPRARRHRDLRLRQPRLDPRRLPPLRREASPLPAQPHGQAGEDAAAGRRGRRRRPRRRRRGLLDGGRRLRPAAHRRALPARTAPG